MESACFKKGDVVCFKDTDGNPNRLDQFIIKAVVNGERFLLKKIQHKFSPKHLVNITYIQTSSFDKMEYIR